MPVTILCPRLRCRTLLRVPDDVRGKRVRCAQCGLAFFVPKSPTQVVPPKKPAESADKQKLGQAG